MNAPNRNGPARGPAPRATPPSPGEAVWRNTFFVLSAMLAGLALLQFDAGRWAHGLGDLGASVLMLSLITQFPFVRAVIQASRESDASPDRARQRQQALMKQAAELRAAHPWADVAGRAGWVLLGISLVLRLTGA
jgi:hypothetical protein